jgi:hypothetical protein
MPSVRKELSEKELLQPKQRAEDVLLGSLGFSEGARIISIKRVAEGFAGVGEFSDGEQFDFRSEDELSALERWALGQLI